VATGAGSLADQWTAYRKAMIDYAGIALFVFGNKRDDKGNIVLSNGMKQEFDLCVRAGVRVLPIGATGFMAAEFWKEVWGNFTKYFPDSTADFKHEFEKLGDASKRPEELLSTVQKLVDCLQKG
jgi:hypothetical protein